ncbi:MAG: DUF1800 family protein [Chitinophagaceae bacterium]|nr:DUF1800 family protein [Chitinophagaceae bacterium]
MSQYTENDVKEAAKVLTGWQINGATYTAVFNLSRHTTTNKTFSAFFNNTVITGRILPPPVTWNWLIC